MALLGSVEAVKNLKTQKLFVLLHDAVDDDHWRVINPAGALINLPSVLFDEEVVVINSDQFSQMLTPEQLDALEQYDKNNVSSQTSASEAVIDRKAAPKPPRAKVAKSAPNAAAKSAFGDTREWASNFLTFYRPYIDALSPHQMFRVKVEGTGVFEMSKRDFLSAFNDVVMSPAYKSEGMFSYKQIPEKANRFRKS